MKELLRVARVLHRTTAEGPGQRTAIWVQGCSIRCRGCINPHLFDANGGDLIDLDELVSGALHSGSEGITLLGGEPFDQPGPCAALARAAQAAGLGVITFTGYGYQELMTRDDEARSLLSATDLLVDGPYVAGLPESRRALVGSSNQQFIHLSARYASYRPESAPNRLDIRVLSDGNIELAGFLKSKELKSLARGANTRRSKG